MKKYAVIKVWKYINTPSVIAQFDERVEAVMFANLSKKSEPKNDYIVFEQDYSTNKEA